jgi:hypothetical protein
MRNPSLGAAYLQSARLHLRSGRAREALAAARSAFALHPRQLASPRTLRIVANALFNQLGHRVLWAVRRR